MKAVVDLKERMERMALPSLAMPCPCLPLPCSALAACVQAPAGHWHHQCECALQESLGSRC